jgi:hypothetical protein
MYARTLGITLALALIASTASATTIGLTPTSQTVSAGSPVTVDLNISGLGNGTALGAFDISVNFDSADLSFQSATFGDPVLGDQLDLGRLGLNGPTATPGTGTVDLIETDIFDSPATLIGTQAHSFTLAVLTFDAMQGGTTPLTETINSLSDQNGDAFAGLLQGANVTIEPSPVPLPSSGWILLAGLMALSIVSGDRRHPARSGPTV